MKKSSLGRRSSAAPARLGNLDSTRNERTSSIPVLNRGTSADRNSSLAFRPSNLHKSRSITNLTASTPSSSRKGYATSVERPSRCTSVSTSSSIRSSSIGGTKSKTDSRPLRDKEWQLEAQLKIENFLQTDPDAHLCVEGTTIKPMSLKLFLEICDLLFQKLDPNISINKANYVSELSFLTKKMGYRGKVEKSWLISVNTQHSWMYVLGLLQYLVDCVQSQTQTDPSSLMFPDNFMASENEDNDIWNMKILLPYIHQSYDLYNMNPPNYEECQEKLDDECISQHFDYENIRKAIEQLQSDIEKIHMEQKMHYDEDALMRESLEKIKDEVGSLSDEVNKKYNYLMELKRDINSMSENIKDMDMKLQSYSEEKEILEKEKIEILSQINDQTVSKEEVEQMKKKRGSLTREIASAKKYKEQYSNMMFEEDLQIVKLREELEKVIRMHNIEVGTYRAYESTLSMATFDQNPMTGLSELDKINDLLSEVINQRKALMKTYTTRRIEVTKAYEDLKNSCHREEQKSTELEAKYEQLEKERSVLTKKIFQEIETLKSKLEKIVSLKADVTFDVDEDIKSILNEKLKVASETAAELDVVKKSAQVFLTSAKKCIEEYEEGGLAIIEDLSKNISKTYDEIHTV